MANTQTKRLLALSKRAGMNRLHTRRHGQDFVFARGTSLPASTFGTLTLALSPNTGKELGKRLVICGNFCFCLGASNLNSPRGNL